jgi:(1->4)-alpha-D-glucan 1-alpha-D-glucosylmutase
MPQEWERTLRRWRKLNTRHRRVVGGRLAPGTNAEYLLYQTLVALWPPPRAGRRVDDLPDRAWRASVRDRLNEYMLKAAREARLCTSWTDPDSEYEAALASFIGAILEPSDDAPFLADVARLVWRIAPIGAANSLARVAVHLTSPGTPDLYQGDEVWSFALVDPDNRRPVDFALRDASLTELPALEARLAAGESLDPYDHRTKLLVTHSLLALRRQQAELFTAGDYRPLDVRGARAAHVIAFARTRGDRACITVASRLIGGQTTAQGGTVDTAGAWWADTHIDLPMELHGRRWRGAFSGADVEFPERRIAMSTALSTLPVAVYSG